MIETLSLYLMTFNEDDEENKTEFQKLYEKYRQPMYRVAYSILHNKEDAEDAVHTAFLSIAENFSKISKISAHKLWSYIVIIIRNTSINIYNANKRRASHNEPLEGNEDSVLIEPDFFKNFNYEMLVDAIGKLPTIYSDVVYLFYYEDLSTKEIAETLEIKQATVLKRLEDARKKLRELLEEGK